MQPETALKISIKTEEKTGKNSGKTTNGGHLRLTVAGILLSASGPLTIRNIRLALEQHDYFNVDHKTVQTILAEIACDQHRVLVVAPMRVGPKKVPADGYQLKEKTAAK